MGTRYSMKYDIKTTHIVILHLFFLGVHCNFGVVNPDRQKSWIMAYGKPETPR